MASTECNPFRIWSGVPSFYSSMVQLHLTQASKCSASCGRTSFPSCTINVRMSEHNFADACTRQHVKWQRHQTHNYRVNKTYDKNLERRAIGDIKNARIRHTARCRRERTNEESRKKSKISISQFANASVVSKAQSAHCQRNVTRPIKIMICEK